MKKYISIPLLIISSLVLIYAFGPTLEREDLDLTLPEINASISNIEEFVAEQESHFTTKPNNESKVIWADSSKQKTEYALLYLHGFTASREEGAPINYDFANRFKMNAFFPRLATHGLQDSEALLNMTPKALYNSVKNALMIARKLGNKVVIMGCSTGCTLTLMLAADYPDLVNSLILYSPNIKINNTFAPLLSKPWGLQLTRLIHGGNYYEDNDVSDFWYNKYRLEAQIYLQQLLDMRMCADEFKKVKQPLFMGYYYKDEQNQDGTILVKAAIEMFNETSTPAELKRAVAFPEAKTHVINNGTRSKSINEVRNETYSFAEEILGLK